MKPGENAVGCAGCGHDVIKGKRGKYRRLLSVPLPLEMLYTCEASRKGHRAGL